MLTGRLALVAAGVRHGPGLEPQGAQEPTRCPSMLMLDSEIICQALTVGRGRALLLTGPEVPACRSDSGRCMPWIACTRPSKWSSASRRRLRRWARPARVQERKQP